MQWHERFEGVKNIYQRFIDNESKYIFEKRCEFLIGRDEIRFLESIEGREKKVWRCPNPENDFIIFGTGIFGKYYYDILQRAGKNVIGFCDNFRKGELFGKPIWSVNDAVKKGRKIFVPAGRYESEMLLQLKQLGVDNKSILLEPDIRSYTGIQYFDVWNPREGEILVDCGAYDGDTIMDFVKWTDHRYEGIYSFEPSKRNYDRCQQYVKENNIENCRLINKGTWSSSATLKFACSSFDTGDHIVGDSGELGLSNNVFEIDATSIDEELSGRKATFIKMDVEGSEMETLKGARETIIKYLPRLAIAVYHKPEDLFDIPLYILELNENYRFKLRHYSSCQCETVLYAECDS